VATGFGIPRHRWAELAGELEKHRAAAGLENRVGYLPIRVANLFPAAVKLAFSAGCSERPGGGPGRHPDVRSLDLGSDLVGIALRKTKTGRLLPIQSGWAALAG
jgi:hypothetical protein